MLEISIASFSTHKIFEYIIISEIYSVKFYENIYEKPLGSRSISLIYSLKYIAKYIYYYTHETSLGAGSITLSILIDFPFVFAILFALRKLALYVRLITVAHSITVTITN